MKEKLKKPLINPWRLKPARYGQDFSTASFSEQEHEAVFLLQLFSGDSQLPGEDPKRFTEVFWFFFMERKAAREALLLSQDSDETRSPCSDFWKLLPAGRKLSEFKVRSVCLPS